MGQRFNPHSNTIEVFPVHIPEMPVHWAAIAADALQNLRAALNYIAWELAKWNLAQQGLEREPSYKTQFPIADTPTKFPAEYVADIHPDHIRLIEAFQPYGAIHGTRADPSVWSNPITRPSAISVHPLVYLRDLSNIDKHRVFQFLYIPVDYWNTGPSVKSLDCKIVAGAAYHKGVFQLHQTWLEFHAEPTGPNPRVDLEEYTVPEPAFDESKGAIWILWHIEMAVVEIADAFQRVFP